MHSLKIYRDHEKGVSDLLPWATLVDDGIVLDKDGRLLAGWFYRGPDTASATPAERNYLTSIFNAAISRFGSDITVNVEAVRMPAASYPEASRSYFPDPISALIEAERREQFLAEGQHFETYYVLILTYTPPLLRNSKIINLMYEQSDQSEGALADKHLVSFQKLLCDFEDMVGTVMILERLKSYTVQDRFGRIHMRDDLVNFLHFCVSGLKHPVNNPPLFMYLDSYIGGQELRVGDTPKIGENFICCVALEGFPLESYPNILEILEHLPVSYRFSNRMILLDQHESIEELKANRRKWKQKERGFGAQVFRIHSSLRNEDASQMAFQMEQAMNDSNSGLVAFGYYTAVVVLMGEDKNVLLENARTIIREVQREGFSCRLETLNTMEAWLGSLPGHIHPNVRRSLIHTQNLADLLPLSSVWAGKAFCPSPLYPEDSPPLLYGATSGSTPFRLNLHHGDVGHTLVFGPTGAGKSTWLAFLIAQFRRYPHATVFAFDKGNSLWALAHATGGQHYEIASAISPQFSPLAVLETDSDMMWAAEWLATCFELQSGKTASPRQKESLLHALKLLRDATQPEHRCLTDYVSNLQDEEIRTALTYYTISGVLGRLLDSREDGLEAGSFTVLEIEELMAMGDKAAIPVLLYLFRRFEKSLKGQPALLVLDEAWVMLGHPVFREKIREWLKVLRKANCAVVMATQSLSDAVKSSIFDVLIESCPTKILLPNEEADKKGTEQHLGPKDLYTIMGLNESQIQLLKNSVKKRHYYYISPEGCRLFDLNLGPVALSFVAVSDKETLAYLRELKEVHGANWPYIWMQERGVHYESLAH